jgi:hypothetical protein
MIDAGMFYSDTASLLSTDLPKTKDINNEIRSWMLEETDTI